MIANRVSERSGGAPRSARLFRRGAIRVEQVLVATVGERVARARVGERVVRRVRVRMRAPDLVGVDVRPIEPVHERSAERAPDLGDRVQRTSHEPAGSAAARTPKRSLTRRDHQYAQQEHYSLQCLACFVQALAGPLAARQMNTCPSWTTFVLLQTTELKPS